MDKQQLISVLTCFKLLPIFIPKIIFYNILAIIIDFKNAIELGYFPLVQFNYKNRMPKNINNLSDFYINLDIVKFIHNIYNINTIIKNDLIMTIHSEKLEIVKYMVDLCECSIDNDILYSAIMAGNIDVFNYILSKYNNKNPHTELLEIAICTKDMHIIKNISHVFEKTKINKYVIYSAILSNDINIVKYIFEFFNINEFNEIHIMTNMKRKSPKIFEFLKNYNKKN